SRARAKSVETSGRSSMTSSCPRLSRASTSFLRPLSKAWMAGTSPAMTRKDGCAQPRRSVAALVDQRALLDPRHHLAQLRADLFGRVLGELGAGRLERGLVDLVLQHPVAGEAAGLDVGEDALHLGARLLRDHAWTGDVFSVFGRVRHR